MRRIAWITFSINFIISGCNNNQTKVPVVKIEEKKVTPTNISPKTDKLLITDFTTETAYGDTSWINSKYKAAYETTDQTVIREFEQLLKVTKSNKYCCCPSRNFILSFFDNNMNYKSYVVESEKGKDSVLIFDYNFQFSSKISKNQWNDLLSKSNKLISNHYLSYDLNSSRELLRFANENKLVFAYGNIESKEWRFYDGDFNFTVSKFGKKLTKEEIENNIRKTYPDDNYHVAFSNYYELCGSSDSKVDDCKTKYTVTISCSEDFYGKFELYKPKSLFNDFHPSFLILGSKNNLIGADRVASKKENN